MCWRFIHCSLHRSDVSQIARNSSLRLQMLALSELLFILTHGKLIFTWYIRYSFIVPVYHFYSWYFFTAWSCVSKHFVFGLSTVQSVSYISTNYFKSKINTTITTILIIIHILFQWDLGDIWCFAQDSYTSSDIAFNFVMIQY